MYLKKIKISQSNNKAFLNSQSLMLDITGATFDKASEELRSKKR